MTTERTPSTEAGRALVKDATDHPIWAQAKPAYVLAIEAEAREGYVTEDNCAHSQKIACERARAEARAPLVAIIDEPCPFCHDATTAGCPESSHAIRNRLRAALREDPS